MAFAVTHDFTNGTNADGTEVNQNFEDIEDVFNGISATGKIPIKLGSGNATIVGDDSRQAVGNFSIAGDIGNGYIEIHYAWTGGDAGQQLFTANTATGVDGFSSSGVGDAQGMSIITFMKSPTTATNISATQELGGAISIYLADNDMFDVSAAETFYINLDTATGNTCKIRWVAYLFPD